MHRAIKSRKTANNVILGQLFAGKIPNEGLMPDIRWVSNSCLCGLQLKNMVDIAKRSSFELKIIVTQKKCQDIGSKANLSAR